MNANPLLRPRKGEPKKCQNVGVRLLEMFRVNWVLNFQMRHQPKARSLQNSVSP